MIKCLMSMLELPISFVLKMKMKKFGALPCHDLPILYIFGQRYPIHVDTLETR